MSYLFCPACQRKVEDPNPDRKKCQFCKKSFKPTRLALKLQEIIKDLTGYTVRPYIHQHRPRGCDIEAGAWRWSMDSDTGIHVGSCHLASEVARSESVFVYEASHSFDPSSIELGCE